MTTLEGSSNEASRAIVATRRMESRTSLQQLVMLPAQILRTGHRIVFRSLARRATMGCSEPLSGSAASCAYCSARSDNRRRHTKVRLIEDQ